MSFRTKRAVAGAFLAVSALTLAACSDSAAPVAPELGTTASAGVDQEAVQQAAAERLGRLVALAFGEPSARGIFRQAAQKSPVVENKLYLASFLRGEGTPVLKAMARAGNVSEAEVLSLVAQAGPLEIYLPVAEHRARWSGGSDLLVAVTLKDHVAPAGFNLQGERVQLSAEAPPATPTVAVVRAEAFDSTGTPYESRVTAAARRGSGARLATTPDQWTGLWITYSYIYNSGQYEGWALGAPEFELFVERGSDRKVIRCTANLVMEPFAWNQDGDHYDNDWLVLWDAETPTLEDRVYTIIEDDSESCKLTPKKDYTKMAADWLKSVGSALKAVSSRDWGGALVNFYHAGIGAYTMFSQDEWVGAIASDVTMDGVERRALIKSEGGADRGYVYMQWKTDYGH